MKHQPYFAYELTQPAANFLSFHRYLRAILSYFDIILRKGKNLAEEKRKVENYFFISAYFVGKFSFYYDK